MNKEEVLKQLFLLSKEDISDIYEILNGFKERINKASKDTLLARCVFIKGYHRTSEFYEKNNFTKDTMYAKALNYETKNIDAYITLKNILEINNDIFLKILNELKDSDIK